ncbi:hypothetical protein EDC04DRAFT_2611838 [Pisolithus marmoratus]|nr:hypothetical protein EDC04DRAFT_2611838 [Pisolithus marmoratus]
MATQWTAVQCPTVLVQSVPAYMAAQVAQPPSVPQFSIVWGVPTLATELHSAIQIGPSQYSATSQMLYNNPRLFSYSLLFSLSEKLMQIKHTLAAMLQGTTSLGIKGDFMIEKVVVMCPNVGNDRVLWHVPCINHSSMKECSGILEVMQETTWSGGIHLACPYLLLGGMSIMALVYTKLIYQDLLMRSAQACSSPFTPVLTALVGVVNTKYPQVGEIISAWLITI